jgi:hypothetical protein
MRRLRYLGPRGKKIKYSGTTITPQRHWHIEECEFLLAKKEDGYTLKEIAKALRRTYVSIHLKHKRLNKLNIAKGIPAIEKKYKTNEAFIQKINPKTILDLHAGLTSFYSKYKNLDLLITNDKNCTGHTFQMNDVTLLDKLCFNNKKFDFIDIDPFGCAYHLIANSIRMATKGIAITFGEFGHRRYKRFDQVGPMYGIRNIEDFTIDNIVESVKNIGLTHKKTLKVYRVLENSTIVRVYFKITPAPKTPTYKKGDF